MKTLTINLDTFGTKAAAERDALEYTHPQIWSNRSALFPSPLDFGVTPKIASTEVVQITEGMTKGNYTIQVTIEVTGDRADKWIQAVRDKSRHFAVPDELVGGDGPNKGA